MKNMQRFGVVQGPEDVLSSFGMLRTKGAVKRFEAAFGKKLGSEMCHATYKGRTAVYLVLKSLGLKEGDEVLVPSFVCETVINPILRAGLKPRLLDIDPTTFTLDIDSLNESVSSRTRALIAVHTFGQPCDLKPVIELAQDHGISVVEDCAQAVGAQYAGKNVGLLGDAAVYSFHIDKTMSTGYGGMALTRDASINERMERMLPVLRRCTFKDDLRVRKRFYEGFMYRFRKIGRDPGDRPYGPSVSDGSELVSAEDYLKEMSPISAAIGLVQLRRLDSMIKRRRENAKLLESLLSGSSLVELPRKIKGTDPAYMTYTVKVASENAREERLRLIRELNAAGIEATNYVWAFAIHQVPYYRRLCDTGAGNYKGTEDAVLRLVNLPVHPLLGEEDMKHMAEVILSMERR